MTQVDWHPYPEEKPKINVDYLVTYKGIGYGIRVGFDGWQTNESWASFKDDEVIAWAELPEPYKSKDEK